MRQKNHACKGLNISVLSYYLVSAVGFFSEERAQGEWSTIYMLLVLIIVALVLIAIVKPMFKESQKVVSRTKSELGAS